MAQSNAMQDQPSMEDILTSIRRIIDDSSAQAAETNAPKSDQVANDDTAGAASPSRQQSMKGQSNAPAPVDEIPELDSFLEALDAKYNAQQQSVDDVSAVEAVANADVKNSTSSRSSREPIDITPKNGNGSVRDNSKYEARFSEDDRTAFVAVGDALNGGKSDRADPVRSGTKSSTKSLVSEPARARVGGSLNNLSEALAQEAQRQLPAMTESMLKPMLADWLDNNLPSMVERLVREEIERIARGD